MPIVLFESPKIKWGREFWSKESEIDLDTSPPQAITDWFRTHGFYSSNLGLFIYG
jgi:hypothetical protein